MSLNSPSDDQNRPGPENEVPDPANAGLGGQLLRLSVQADHLQTLLEQLTGEVASNSDQVAVLTRA